VIVFVVVLAVVAVALLLLLVTTRRRLDVTQARATTAEQRATEQAAELESTTAARDAADRARADAEERATAADARSADAEERAAAADSRAAEAQAQVAAAAAERDEARHEADAAAASRLAAEDRVAELERRAAEATAAHATAAEAAENAVTTAPAASGQLDAQLVWALEKARSERTWRQSVAVGPGGSAFTEAADPLYEALQIELDAAREDVGAVVELDAALPTSVTAAGAVLTLRAVQELLAGVVRRAESTTVRVRAEGVDVLVEIDSVDEDGHRIEPGPLPTPPSPAIESTPTGVRIRDAVTPPSPD
jgi:hypothetical protein